MDTTFLFRLEGKCLAGKNWKAQIVCRAGHTIISKWMHVCFCFVRCCPPCIPRRCAGDIKKYVRFDFNIGGAGSKIWGGRYVKGLELGWLYRKHFTSTIFPKQIIFVWDDITHTFRATLPGPQRRIKNALQTFIFCYHPNKKLSRSTATAIFVYDIKKAT